MKLGAPGRRELISIGAILAFGLTLRIESLAAIAGSPLRPDAVVYRHLAMTLPSPYETGIREPGWPWLVRAWFTVFGSSEAALRTSTVMLSTALIGLVWWAGRQLSGRPSIGLIASLFVAWSDALVRQSPSGLRLEAWSIALVSFGYVAFARAWNPRRTSMLLAISGAAVMLINLASITAVVPLIAYAAWRGRLGLRRATLIYAVVLAVLVPHWTHEQNAYGDPFHSTNVHAVFYRNHEFVRSGHRCDGCPTPAQYALNAYAGRPVTWIGYIFGLHTPRVVVSRFAHGFEQMFVTENPIFRRARGWVVRLLWLVGVAVLLTRRQREVLLLPVLALGGTAFVVPLRPFDWRVVFDVTPMMYLVAAVGVAAITDALRRAVRQIRAG